jgi:hypothetical protein
MYALVRLLLIYAAALCLTLAAFAMAPILGLADEAPSRVVVPWLLVLGGLLGALDCWRLSRRLQARMDARTRDRWLPQRVELFARERGDFAVLLACLGIAAVVVFYAAVGTPNTNKRPTGPLPALAIKSQTGPDGKAILTMSEQDLAKLRRYLTVPAQQKMDPWLAAKALLIPVSFGLLVAMGYFRYRRDGRASLVLDAHGIHHAWIGRVAWPQVQAMTIEPLHGYASEVLVLLVDNPASLRARLPREEAERHKLLYADDGAPGEIVLSLDEFDADPKRLISAARRLREGASPPPLKGWSFGLAASSVQQLLQARDADDAALRMKPERPAPVPSQHPAPLATPVLALGWGDRLSIAWVSLMAMLGAAQLFSMTLFGRGLWLLP